METEITLYVSVIVPNYNHAPFLKARIESVLNQTYQNFELIILDDCSTDNSREVIEQYSNHPKVAHIVFNESNSGSTFKQWQKGITLARYKYIWIAESDDYADVNFLKEVAARFDQDIDIGIVYCDSNIVKDDQVEHDFYKKYKNNTFKTQHWSTDYLITGQDEINSYLIYDCTINNTSAMVFKKDLIGSKLFENLNLFRYSGDWYFFLYIAQFCKISYISTAMNYFRQGTNNFAKGIKSPLNHFKERSLVRYMILEDFIDNIDSKHKVFEEIGLEFRYKIQELIKHPTNFNEFYKISKYLYNANKFFFIKQLKYSFRNFFFIK